MSHRYAFAVLTHIAAAAVAFGQISTNFPEFVSPGERLQITAPGVAGNTVTIGIHLIGGGAPPTDQQVTGEVTGSTVTLALPAKLTPGRYFLTLTETTKNGAVVQTVPGEIRIPNGPVKLDSTHPTTAYRNSLNNLFDFDVVGENFSVVSPQDNSVSIAGQGPIIKTWEPSKDACRNLPATQLPCLWINQPQIIHVIGYKAEPYQGPLSLTVTVGSAASQPTQLVLSRMSETGVIFWAVLIFAGLGWFVFWLISRGIRQNIIAGKQYNPFQAFFLDRQSNSYSLSKFQFLLFVATFVFGYLYVFLCRWLVQWQFILPDVPSNFSGILAISAGTTVASAGATSTRGSKGGGPMYPSMADFISTGGQVVPERFQLFVWSLVACGGFLALMISQNPATITGFPTFPDGLLYVMGVSSAGYLGGKLTRKPGPVIRNIVLDKTAGQTIVIQGENLSRDGDFLIDGKKLPIVVAAKTKTPDGTPVAADAKGKGDATVETMVQSKDQDGATDKSFASELTIKIDEQIGVDVRTGDHMFRIVNPDSQFNEVSLTGDLPQIKAVWSGAEQPDPPDQKQIGNRTGPVPVRVKGEGFRIGMTASWKPDGATDPIELGTSAVTVDGSQNATVTLTPGKAGTGVLLLTTPAGHSATATVKIV
jgi:hypothetical protein